MNNEEFRKLIKRSSPDHTHQKQQKSSKSTKEIAREIVEQEFQERSRKRGRDEDYLSDDDDDYDDGDKQTYDRKEKNVKGANKKSIADDEELDSTKIAKNKKKDREKKPKYRDRAKERREGKSQQDPSDMIASHLDEEMTKYLGGDEEHTHLVKGLDKALADKVRREEIDKEIVNHEDEQGDIDLDKIIDETVASAKRLPIKRMNELSSLNVVNNSTNLTSGMMSYLNRLESIKNKPEPALVRYGDGDKKSQAAQLLIRTMFYFSLDANIGQRYKSWEIPKESTLSASEYDRIYQTRCPSSCTPVDSKLLQNIKTAFSSMKRNERSSKHKEKSEFKAEQKNSNDFKKMDTESDDDIFGDIGEYIPPTKMSS